MKFYTAKNDSSMAPLSTLNVGMRYGMHHNEYSEKTVSVLKEELNAWRNAR